MGSSCRKKRLLTGSHLVLTATPEVSTVTSSFTCRCPLLAHFTSEGRQATQPAGRASPVEVLRNCPPPHRPTPQFPHYSLNHLCTGCSVSLDLSLPLPTHLLKSLLVLSKISLDITSSRKLSLTATSPSSSEHPVLPSLLQGYCARSSPLSP